MKKQLGELTLSSLSFVAILLCVRCLPDEEIAPPAETTPRTTIGTGGFSLWTTCGSNAYVSGSNIVVIGTGCSNKVNVAQASSASEMAIFTCDNVTLWNGNEMGFVRTLNDNVLKGYLQGGGQYIYTAVSAGSSYKCSATGAHQVDFYVNEQYRTSLTNNSGSYQNRNYYFVATNHYYGGGNPANWAITFNSANVW